MATKTARRRNHREQQEVTRNRVAEHIQNKGQRDAESAQNSVRVRHSKGTGGSSSKPSNAGHTVPAMRPSDPLFREVWGGGYSTGDYNINETTALNFSAIYSAVTLIASAIATMPVKIIKKDPSNPRNKIEVPDHPAHRIMNFSPDGETPALLIREAAQAHTLLTGNCFFEIVRNGRFQATEMHLINPGRVDCFRDARSGKKIYNITNIDGIKNYANNEIVHIPALTWDGCTGMSPVKLARSTIKMGLVLQDYGNNFFQKGGVPPGYLTKPNIVPKAQRETHREEWKEMMEGYENWFAIGLLSGGLEWKNLGFSPEDCQFLTTRQFQVEEIARWYHVPLHMLMVPGKAGVNNNTEQMLMFVVFTLLPWIRRWEAELNMKLFTRVEQSIYSVKFNLEGLLRGDVKARTEICEKLFKNGIITMNEWRELEERNVFSDCGDQPFILASQLATARQVEQGLNENSPLKKKDPAATPAPDSKTTDLVFASLNELDGDDE